MLARRFPLHASAGVSLTRFEVSLFLQLRGHIILHSGGVAKDGRNTEKGVVAEDREVPWVPRAPQQGRLDKFGRGKKGNEGGGYRIGPSALPSAIPSALPSAIP